MPQTSSNGKSGLQKLATLIIVLLTLAYPFIIYYGLNHFGVGVLAITLLVMMALRALMLRRGLSFKNHLPILGALTFISLGALLRQDPRFFFYYPVLVSFVMLILFGLTLRKPPSMIEQFARMTEPHFPPEAVPYCWKVTLVWCCFFCVNGLIALATALKGDMKIWTVYNGFMSYLFMGLLFGIEYLVRRMVKRKHRQAQNGVEERSSQ